MTSHSETVQKILEVAEKAIRQEFLPEELSWGSPKELGPLFEKLTEEETNAVAILLLNRMAEIDVHEKLTEWKAVEGILGELGSDNDYNPYETPETTRQLLESAFLRVLIAQEGSIDGEGVFKPTVFWNTEANGCDVVQNSVTASGFFTETTDIYTLVAPHLVTSDPATVATLSKDQLRHLMLQLVRLEVSYRDLSPLHILSTTFAAFTRLTLAVQAAALVLIQKHLVETPGGTVYPDDVPRTEGNEEAVKKSKEKAFFDNEHDWHSLINLPLRFLQYVVDRPPYGVQKDDVKYLAVLALGFEPFDAEYKQIGLNLAKFEQIVTSSPVPRNERQVRLIKDDFKSFKSLCKKSGDVTKFELAMEPVLKNENGEFTGIVDVVREVLDDKD